MKTSLSGGWTVRALGGEVPDAVLGRTIPATVPGCVHLDLLAAGLIPDPYLDENESAVAWVGRADWCFETSFDWAGTDDNQIDLVALGLDTVATIELNGSVVGWTENMHRSYRFPIAGLIRRGSNKLTVTFTSALNAAELASEKLGPRPHVNAHPFNAIRKMACNFGWDWGPDLVTAGIWREIAVQSWRGARLAAVRPLVYVDGSTGLLRMHVDVARTETDGQPMVVEVDMAGVRTEATLAAAQSSVVIEVPVDDVRVWWPHGYGEQPLYPVALTLHDPSGQLDCWEARVGFRTIALDTRSDEHGTAFTLSVNGVPVFVRGVNWIPDDAFPSRVTRARYAERLHQARDANVNLVRVWGGGIYESADFYETCDELGLLVWQDFLFACAAYAEEEPLRGEVVAEAREAVTRLSPHPSLVLWNGCNENIWGHRDWGWQESLGERTWGWGYYSDLLPSIVAELDPTRPYSPGSPYSMSPDLDPNDPAHGTMHIWDVWNERDYTAYRDYVPRFAAEFGFQGPPAWATLIRAIHDVPLTADSPGMLAHQKAEDGNAKLARGLEGHLAAPRSFDEWHWATSLNQARALACGIEHLRSWAPVCMGAVMWQLNDCWPVTSWAAIDGDGRRKPLWFALRHSYRDRLLTLQPRDGYLALVVINDSPRRWGGTVQVSRRAFDGTIIAQTRVPIDVEARGQRTVRVPDHVATAEDPAHELLLAELGRKRAWWPFAEDVAADLPVAQFDAHVDAIKSGYRLTVTARTLLRDLALLVDRVAPDAIVDDMLVTLLPGESTTFQISTSAELAHDQLVDPLVLRSANQLSTNLSTRVAASAGIPIA